MSDPAPGTGPARTRDAGGQVLVWMRDEFEALRRQVHALATSVAQQRAMLSEMNGSPAAELTTSLAELEGCAAALRNDSARLQSIERTLGDRLAAVVGEAVAQQAGDASMKGIEGLLQDRLTDVVADAVRPQLRAAIAARLPELVNEVIQPQVRAALAEIHGCTIELRDEYARLRALRDDLTVRFPRLVEASVERVLERHAAALAANATPAASAAPPATPAATGESTAAGGSPAAAGPSAPTSAGASALAPSPSAPSGPTFAGPTATIPSEPSGPTGPAPADPLGPTATAPTRTGSTGAPGQSEPGPTGPSSSTLVPAQDAPAPTGGLSAPADPAQAAGPGPEPAATSGPPAVAWPAPSPQGQTAGPSAADPPGPAPAPYAPARASWAVPVRPDAPPATASPSTPAPSVPANSTAESPSPAGGDPHGLLPTPAEPDASQASAPHLTATNVQTAAPPAPAGAPQPAVWSSGAEPGGNGPGGLAGAIETAEPPPPPDPAVADVTAEAPAPAAAPARAGGGVRYAEAAAAAAAAAGVGDGISCVLPGMVVGPSLAVGVGEALSRARLRRRRRRRAAPPAAGLYRRDPFAGQVTRRLERFARGRAATPPSPARGGGGAGWATVVVGERDGAEVGIDLSISGMFLWGPAGPDVVRAAVTGLLAAHGPSTMAAIVTGDLLPAVAPFPGLAQTAAIGPAIDELEAEVGRRVQLLTDDGVPDAGAYRSKRPDANFPMIVLAATDVSGPDLERLRALFHEGARAGVSGIVVAASDVEMPDDGGGDVLLGPGGLVAEARSDRLGDELTGARLFQMEPTVAAELLAVLASARTDGEHMQPVHDDDESFVPATSAATAPVAVQLLGVYRIEVDGTEIKSGLRAKARELLAFYLLHPEGATLDEAIEALWPEADPRRGSEWFWTALGNLRTKLRQATGQKELKVIDRDGDIYRIEDVFDVDLWSLQHSLKEGAQSRDDGIRQSALDRAVADYDGDLLVGLDWFWLETPREDLRQRMVDVLVWLGDRRWAAGDARAAWSALQRALEVDPYAEQIYRRIMRLQAKLSRPDDADITYRRLVAKLQEVDLQPTSETDKLHAEVCPQT